MGNNNVATGLTIMIALFLFTAWIINYANIADIKNVYRKTLNYILSYALLAVLIFGFIMAIKYSWRIDHTVYINP